MPASIIPRYGFDDLRRFAAALGRAGGLAPARALAMATHLLWFDAAGAESQGIASLPEWLEAIEGGQFDPKAMGRVTGERSSLANFDGEDGLPPLLLERIAELAVEKAGETAVGLVRAHRVGAVRSAAAVAAGIARGPMAGLVLGPNGPWSMALPSEAGLPVLADSELAIASRTGKPGTIPGHANSPGHAGSRRDGWASAADWMAGLWLGAEILVPADGWLVVAVAVPAIEPLSSFHHRVSAAMHDRTRADGWLLPAAWEAHRRETREKGIAVAAPAWKSLNQWARRLGRRGPRPASSPIGTRLT